MLTHTHPANQSKVAALHCTFYFTVSIYRTLTALFQDDSRRRKHLE
jgi:hypothetical protein